MPLWTSDPVFEKFRYHLKTIFREDRNNPKQRFLYIEGIRKEKVVLVAHADTFRDFIKRKNGYTEPDKNRRTDIVNLCREIAGVIFSIGYYDEHTTSERINIGEWESTLNMVRCLIAGKVQRFPLT